MESPSLEELFARKKELIIFLTSRTYDHHVAEDVAQECYLRLAQLDEMPRPNPMGWLKTTGVNIVIDMVRANNLTQDTVAANADVPDIPQPENRFERDLEFLKETCGDRPITMARLNGMTLTAIAEDSGRSLSRVSQLAKQELRDIMSMVSLREAESCCSKNSRPPSVQQGK